MLTIAKGFLPCSSAGHLTNSCRELLELKAEDTLWRQCYLQQYPERSCKVALSWRCRLAMRQPLRELRLEGTEAVLDWEAALLVLGSPLSGKTWLVHRFCQGKPPECLDKVPFLGTNLRVSHLQLRGPQPRTGRLRNWEPSEVSRQALGGYLKAAQMVLVCVDLEDLGGVASEAQRLLAQVMQSMRPGTILGLCGLKSDRLTTSEQRRICATLRRVAQGCGAEFGMCSATRGEGVDEIFCAMLAACLESSNKLPPPERVLSRLAGTLSNAELLRTLLRRVGHGGMGMAET